ncbi:outer membrane lipoprotein carrier protein LolA, partial [Pseudomonas marginalis]
MSFFVGAGLPAKIFNDHAGCLAPRVVLRFFAGKPA